ncbi:MAG: GNAT family N-acetyltransferase [bacterium]|nr:GNAT family N-acetyltransferase [bacterium]
MADNQDDCSPEYPILRENLPPEDIETGKYIVRFARDAGELDALQRLRFDVFNVEMKEGFDESWETRRDADRFDPFCHHLVVIEKASGDIIGTYRMMTGEMADRNHGFYSADEFNLSGFPDEILSNSVEIGRASIAKPFRNRQVLFLLFRGLARYMVHNRKRYLFGCCSLTSQDPAEGRRVMDYLDASDHVHGSIRIDPQPDWLCYPEDADSPAPAHEDVKLPKLFSLYMRMGALVVGPPAIDRYFKTIDYLVLIDIQGLDPVTRRLYFG